MSTPEGTAEANNITVLFPPKPLRRDPEKQLIGSREEVTEYIDKITTHYAEYLVSNLSLLGVDITAEGFADHYSLSIECMRSSIYKSFGIDHALQPPMQEMIDEIAKFISPESV